MKSFIKRTLDRWKLYTDVSDAGEIIRRYFVMNFFDGMLTALGIMLGFFLMTLDGELVLRTQIIKIASLTAVAIGISGFTGSRFAETTERKLKVLEIEEALCILDEKEENHIKPADPDKLRKAMGIFNESTPNSTLIKSKPEIKSKPIEGLFDITTIKEKLENLKEPSEVSPKHTATLYENAQRFASNFAACVDGFSPFFGVIIVIIPFTISINGEYATLMQFIGSFLITFTTLAVLGVYLAKLSRESKILFAMKMIGAAILTTVVSWALDGWI